MLKNRRGEVGLIRDLEGKMRRGATRTADFNIVVGLRTNDSDTTEGNIVQKKGGW